jgi:hypothetical protein
MGDGNVMPFALVNKIFYGTYFLILLKVEKNLAALG